MKTIDNLFVPYELALKLKEKDFYDKCLRAYDDDTKELISFKDFRTIAFTSGVVQNENLIGLTAAPLYQQVVDWLREEHAINVCAESTGLFYYYGFVGKKGAYSKSQKLVSDRPENGYSYYTALTKAIETALTLIK